MIKCNVTVCGTVCRQAQMRANKEGKQFISFGINVVVQAKTGINKTVEISVAKDGDNQAELVNYPVGSRIEVAGVLQFHKKGDALYLNLSASGVNTFNAGSQDAITGTIEFRGTIGKQVDVKTDKKGKPYTLFSAYSSEKDGDNYAYTWIRFMQFDTTKETGYRQRQASMPRVICRWEPTTTASTSLAVSPSLLHGIRKQHPPTNNE